VPDPAGGVEGYAEGVRIDRDRLRVYGLAVAAGLVAEIGLAFAIYRSNANAAGLLFFVEAVVLGLVFGAKPGMVGAVVPLVVLYPLALALTEVDEPASAAVALLFVIIVEAFLAGMAGAMKERYWTRSVPPPGA
jgi:hypothetical protein